MESGLTERELEILRERLERARAEVAARLRRDRADVTQTDSDAAAEPMDMAELTREQSDGAVFSERDRALRDEIERAIARFESGRYGVSELSGRPIGFKRLEAIPWARVTAEEADAAGSGGRAVRG